MVNKAKKIRLASSWGTLGGGRLASHEQLCSNQNPCDIHPYNGLVNRNLVSGFNPSEKY